MAGLRLAVQAGLMKPSRGSTFVSKPIKCCSRRKQTHGPLRSRGLPQHVPLGEGMSHLLMGVSLIREYERKVSLMRKTGCTGLRIIYSGSRVEILSLQMKESLADQQGR